MALSLDAIHKPLNDFFLQRFNTAVGSPVMFRFDKFGSVISEQDFIDPLHPELGYSPSRVTERLSDLVNHIPADSGDGISLVFRLDAIDTAYFFRMLAPAQPADAGNQNLVDSFSVLKAEALKVWQNITLESSSGLMLQFKPAMAGPPAWYDKSASEIWTRQSFSIGAPAAPANAPPAAQPPQLQLWRLKLDDRALADVLETNRARFSDSTLQTLTALPAAQPDPIAPATRLNIGAAQMARVATPLSAIAAGPAVARASTGFAHAVPANVAIAEVSDVGPVRPALHDALRTQMIHIDVADRFQLAQAIGESAPTQPAATDSIAVSFDYCLVNIRRPWLVDAFVNDHSWCVPATAKGAITSGPGGNGFALLPIAFAAIKNLTIEANWNASDIDTAANASDFGPFKITDGIAQNKLSHEGIQVIGWLVQQMPELPPNDPPA